MARSASAEFRCLFGTRAANFLFCVAGLAGLLVGTPLFAQDAPVPQDEPVKTLHVYANLIQIPTLVLDPQRRPLKNPIAANRFGASTRDRGFERRMYAKKAMIRSRFDFAGC
jgi:hypothetical protein